MTLPSWRERRVQYFFVCAFLFAALVATTAAWAASADPVGRVIRTLGVVEAVAPDGSVRRLRRQDPVFEGDTLRTGGRGRAQIRFTDRGLLSLRPDTVISVDDYDYSPSAPASARQELNLTRGGFRTLTGRIADNNRAGYSVRTPLAVIGVRGTIYDAFQVVGGALVLGVSDGAIEARTASGRLARLGIDTGFNFARINSDGSVEYLIAPPAELETSPELDEGEDDSGDGGDDGSDSGDGGDDGGDGGSGGDEGGELGSAEESTVAEGGGEAESTAGTPTDSSTTVVETTSDPENTGTIAQSETGTGDLPTETPVLGAVLSQEQRSALISGTDVVVIAGVRVSGTTPGGEPIEEGLGVGSGIGTLDADGEPVLAGAFGVSNFGTPLDFESVFGDREALLALSDAVLTGGSSDPGAIFDGARTFLPAGGDAGVVWGSFAQPARIFIGTDNVGSFVDTQGDNDLLFVLGTPSDIADRTGVADFELLDWRAATTGGFIARDLIAEFDIDFDTGAVAGILDLSLSGQEDPATELFGYIVGVSAALDGGLLTDVTTSASLFEVGAETSIPALADVSGFLSGSLGEFLNLGFAYSVEGRPELDAQGLVLLGEVPRRPLTSAELALLNAGYGYVEAECCFNGGRVFQNRITDPRAVAPGDIVIAGGGFSPFDAAFNDVPPNDVILRPDQGVVQFFNTSEIGGAELSWFELQGFSDGPGLPGGPIGVYQASTGARITQATSELLILTGRIADVASLTGRARYSLGGEGFLTQGFFNVQSGGFGSFVDTDPSAGSVISFNVDFGTGAITNGFLRLFTDPDEAGTPFDQAFSRDGIDVGFDGAVALSNDNPFVDFNITRGFVTDADGDAGGSGIIDVGTSDMAGFFAGDGSVFNLAFNFNSAPDPEDGTSFLSPTNFVGTAILTRDDLALTTAEQAELALGRVFVAVECCDADDGIGAGPAGDPRNVGGDLLLTDGRFILGLNVDAMGEDLRPNDPGFLSTDIEQVARIASAFGFVATDFPSPPGSDLVVGGWTTGASSDVFNSPLIADATTGELLDTLSSTLLFHTGIPTDIATLQADGSFLTFSGASNEGFRDATGLRALGGFGRTNLFDLDPSLPRISGASASFNIDLATGQVYNGHLFSLTEIDSTGSFPEEFGFEVFFNGQLAYENGNAFLDAVILDGVFNETVAVDTEFSELMLFLTGDPTAPDGFLLAQGAYFLRSVTDPDFGETIQLGGTFSIGTGTYFETRLSIADAAALDTGRLGIAVYSDLSFGFPSDVVVGGDGLLIGRANAPTGNDFLLGANYYRHRQSFDPTTRAPLFDMNGDRVLEPANTARRGFFAQPYDLIVRQEGATETLFNADVVPSGGVSFTGFEVAWGVWQSSGSTDSARIQDDPEDGFSGGVLDRQLFFASVNPTPQSQMPVTGTMSYSSALEGSFGADFLGAGSGELLMLSGSEVNLDFLDVSFDVDFGTGQISNGSIQTGYSFSTDQVRWTGAFDGFVNGAVADLELNSLGVDLLTGGMPSASFAGDLANSSIGGIFTGPNAERVVGGFNFRAQLDSISPSAFEAATGVFILDNAVGRPAP